MRSTCAGRRNRSFNFKVDAASNTAMAATKRQEAGFSLLSGFLNAGNIITNSTDATVKLLRACADTSPGRIAGFKWALSYERSRITTFHARNRRTSRWHSSMYSTIRICLAPASTKHCRVLAKHSPSHASARIRIKFRQSDQLHRLRTKVKLDLENLKRDSSLDDATFFRARRCSLHQCAE